MTDTATLQPSPLRAFHAEQGAKLVSYAGWELPLHYGSIGEEHLWTRSSGSLFDVSHMGRLRISGRHARRFLDRVCTRLIRGMAAGQCRYSLVCNEAGGCLDDVLVYCFADDDYLVVCNGANRPKIVEHFRQVKAAEDLTFKLDDQTLSTCMVAIQGPKVMDLIGGVSREVPTLKRYRFTVKNVLVMKIIVSRTGYTGEDGVEVILGANFARQALGMLLKDVGGENAIVRPAGLGARDSLRMEAGMPLYGHELVETTNPFAIGLGRGVSLEERSFPGRDALAAMQETPSAQNRVGLVLAGKRPAREGAAVFAAGGQKPVGVVTSGTFSPSVGVPIAMAMVDAAVARPGTPLEVDIRGSRQPATVSPLPFPGWRQQA